MRKRLSQLTTVSAINAFLEKAKGRMSRSLPAAAAKSAVQLPVANTPFEAYVREKLIQLLDLSALAADMSVLEIGCGVGDLLRELAKFGPKELFGVDSSPEMVALASRFLEGMPIDVSVADVRRLPFPEKSFDLVVVMFEMQHVFDEKQLDKVVYEVCRVSRKWVVLVEETAPKPDFDGNLLRRPVAKYKEEFGKKRFHLRQIDYLNVEASRYVYTGRSNPWHWIRWVFSPVLYLMGFPREIMAPPLAEERLPDSGLAMALQKATLPLVRSLDGFVQKGEGITVMRFERERLFRRGL